MKIWLRWRENAPTKKKRIDNDPLRANEQKCRKTQAHTHTHTQNRETDRQEVAKCRFKCKIWQCLWFRPPPIKTTLHCCSVKIIRRLSFPPKKKHFSRNGIAKGTKPPRNSSATISDRIQTLITLRLGKVSSRQVLLLLFVCLFFFQSRRHGEIVHSNRECFASLREMESIQNYFQKNIGGWGVRVSVADCFTELWSVAAGRR